MTRPGLIASLLLGALAAAAAAQDVLLYRAGQTPDARDVARILGGKPAEAAAPGDAELGRTRSLREADGPATRGFKLVQPATRPDAARPERIARPATGKVVRPGGTATARNDDAAPTALALGVQFGFDSAEILPSARAQLDALAEGIKLLGPDQRVLIEGHTDATGSDDYNLSLSQRRAASVKQYLISVHGIDGARLEAVGLGKTRPLYVADPFAPENRRVQFQGG
jgi:outer membrane protein OmpA-like peptidoglycan-associated protein